MQSILFLRPSDGAPVERIINLDLLSTASVHPDNPEWTQVICGNATITLHSLTFDKFKEQVENLISENYRIGAETSVKWHQKRMEDTQRIMDEVLTHHLNGH